MFVCSFFDRLSPSTYSALCAVCIGLANLIYATAYEAHVFSVESVIHSVHDRDPNRVGAHDGYYGMAVSNAFYMISTIIVPSLNNYMRCKWILVISSASFAVYFLSFQVLHRYLYFVCCSFMGFALGSFNVGYLGYLTESSTKETLSSNMALSWGISSVSVLAAGVVNFLMAHANSEVDSSTVASNYREYSDTEVRIFFAIMTAVSVLSMALYALLPNKKVADSISKSTKRTKSIKEQVAQMASVLSSRRVLILAPFYLYIGLFFSLWITVIPTTLQFTMVLSKNPYVPMLYGIAFTGGTSTMCVIVMKLSARYPNICCKPMMIVSAILHLSIFAVVVAVVPEWSTVRHNDEPSLLIQPSVWTVIVLAFLLGAADLANNNMRTVISSLVMPKRRQQMFGVSRFYHGMAASALFFGAPALSIYSYVALLTAFLIVATAVYLYTCSYLEKEEKMERQVKRILRRK
ncbi:hypothetical protein PFISCL1PPCAC_23588, partial [Pristionchus fissidentatus]